MKLNKLAVAVSMASLVSMPAWADINVGITVSATGPASALGAPQKNTVALLPATIAGEKVNWIVLDDATDPTQASKNAKKLAEEDKVDVIIGSSTVSNTIAVTEIAVESKTPLLALGPVATLPPEKDHWVFRLPQHNRIMAGAIADDMVANGVKSIGVIGFADPYGESFMAEMKKAAEAKGIPLTVTEKFNRADTSVMGQAMKLIAAKPDAVLIVSSGTPSALPHSTLVERGYKGRIYQTHGAIGRDVLRVGGKALEGGIFVTGPIVVADQLPDSNPMKAVIDGYVKSYEAKYGAGTVGPQGAHLWDAYLLLNNAVPTAKAKAKPGTPEFRAALRDAIEGTKNVVGVHGVYNISPTDHFGHDNRARVLVKVENGAYKLMRAE